MSFRDRLKRASYNDIEFYLQDLNVKQGRRTATIRLAGSNDYVIQDLGLEPLEFEVTAKIGPVISLTPDSFYDLDYDLRRDSLETALNTEGVGKLILPTRAEAYNVIITSRPTVQETKDSQGSCIINFTALESPVGDRLIAIPAGNGLSYDFKGIQADALVDFGQTYEPSSLSKYLSSPTEALQGVSTKLRAAQSIITSITNPAADFNAAIDQINNDAATLLQAPTQMASLIMDTMVSVLSIARTVTDGSATPVSAVDVLTFGKSDMVRTLNRATRSVAALGGNTYAPEDSAVPAEIQERENVRAIYRLARVAALSEYMDIIRELSFDSKTLAVEVLNFIRDEVENLQSLSPTDELYNKLSDFRANAIQFIVEASANLPSVIEIQQLYPIPSLVLAHKLYGNARREQELVDRNDSPTPWALSGNLEVLSS